MTLPIPFTEWASGCIRFRLACLWGGPALSHLVALDAPPDNTSADGTMPSGGSCPGAYNGRARDNCQVGLNHLGEVPLPVDIHTAQATLQTGCVRLDQRKGAMGARGRRFETLWKDALSSALDGTSPLRLDEPLWRLRRQGCRKTAIWPCAYRDRCPVVAYCQPGRIRLTVAGSVNLDQSEWKVDVHPPRSSKA